MQKRRFGVQIVVAEHVYPRFVPVYTLMFPNTLLVEDAENDEQCVSEHLGTCWGNMWEHFLFHMKNMFFRGTRHFKRSQNTQKPILPTKNGGLM